MIHQNPAYLGIDSALRIYQTNLRMPKRITPLSDTKIRTAKTQKKPITMFDGGGLYLLITPSGGKLWRFKYRFYGKEKLLSLGLYPENSLSDARQLRDEARRQIAHGIYPGVVKKAKKQAAKAEKETFEAVAREWHIAFTPSWAPRHGATILSRLNHDLIPWLGSRHDSKSIKSRFIRTGTRDFSFWGGGYDT